MKEIIRQISQQLQIGEKQIQDTLTLLEEGNTVPFIARYRKEMTKGLDEEQIRIVAENYAYQINLAKRKEDVQRLIEVQGKLTEEICKAIEACTKLSEVEDIYRPYQQKKKTRASEADAKGLRPLADWLLALPVQKDVLKEAKKYVNDQVAHAEEALQGAKDIIAEIVSDDPQVRTKIRSAIERYGKIVTEARKGHHDDKKVYRMYYAYEEPLRLIAPHRIMAIDRGEKEKILRVSFSYDKDPIEKWVIHRILRHRSTSALNVLEDAVHDGLKRLAFPGVEREIRSEWSDRAKEKSIDVFSMNLERLLMQPPMKDKMILGLDPAFRTGCKLAVIDKTGEYLEVGVIYPHPPVNKKKESEEILLSLLRKYPIDIIAIGNGTASRESEQFIADMIRRYHLSLSYTLVSEAGASVYSASKLARDEFPDLHVEQRSAISIARRIQDPLSELIKIEPQAIGVGQYQHDLPAVRLKERLDFVVTKAVNRVGVNVNTASMELLRHISGLNASSAKAIVTYRKEHGKIHSREELMDVPKIGARSFEQAAGFLRVENSHEPLDRTSIHPESYALTEKVLTLLHIKKEQMGTSAACDAVKECDVHELCEKLHADVYTVQDILDSIAQPLRDYRDSYDGPLLRSDVLTMEDLHEGDELEGVVRNVVDFGAFVDIGLKEDGLIHISHMSTKRISHPSMVVAVGDIVKVWVNGIDSEKQKVQLSLLPVKSVK